MNRIDYQIQGKPLAPSVVTIGNFDGVHKGHRQLIQHQCQLAAEQGLGTSVLCFDPAPGEYFAIAGAFPSPIRLVTARDKIRLLLETGVDRVITLRFDGQLQSMSAEDFFANIVIDICQAQGLVLGTDFRFGHNRQGDIALLQQLCRQAQCHLDTVELFTTAGEKISSSNIRLALQNNNLARCNQELGYDYFITGRIIHGDGRGKSIGFATANIEAELPLILNGVFATRLQRSDGTYLAGVTNIGTKPTFDGTTKSCESHLFDFCEDIYNETVTLSFCQQIRPERAFDSVKQLVAQIQYDAAQARDYFQK